MGILTKAVSTIARALGMTDPRLYHYASGGPTYSGESVTVNTAMQLDVVWACVRLISQTIATLPLFLYKRDVNGQGIVDASHGLYRILHDRPNADMTAVEFWEAMVASILLWGNAYAYIDKIKDRVIAITPMRPDFVTIRRQTDGSLIYTYSWMGEVNQFTEDQVLHIKGFSLDGMVGISPISQARQSLGNAIAAEKSAGSFFRNGMRPSKIMKAPTFLTDAQRSQAHVMIERYSGSYSTGGVPLLEGGWDISDVSLKPEDAQLLQTRGFHVEQICRWFDVPPPMIGHTEKSTAWGTGLEQMNLWFLMYALRPHLKRIEQVIAKSLLTADEQTTHYAEFNLDGILRADSSIRANLYKTQIAYGLKTPNEIRALENDPPDPDGNDLMIMSQLLPIKLLGEFVRGRQPAPLDPNFKPDEPAHPPGTENPDAPA